MRIDASRAWGGYAAVMTGMAAWLALGGAAEDRARLSVLDVERINVREPDGKLRMVIASSKRMPGIIIDGRDHPHPTRTEGGMLFYNDEESENGGLIFDGRIRNGQPTNGGSLTFDRWHQDQTVQLFTDEKGAKRRAGVIVNDHPDGPMDIAATTRAMALPEPARSAAFRHANVEFQQRAYLGRKADGSSQLELGDAAGRPRLRLQVTADGRPSIALLDAGGRVTRTIE
ncbi:hypothetical protein ACU5AX_00435 [Sphingomonas sp. XXL09]|uniref:hypothetical protein n=1 Tax=Sphingomonas sp. XXL09 TaxID=3457787 RepID=UPI00406BBA12